MSSTDWLEKSIGRIVGNLRGFKGSSCAVAHWVAGQSLGETRYVKRVPRRSRTVLYQTSVPDKCDM